MTICDAKMPEKEAQLHETKDLVSRRAANVSDAVNQLASRLIPVLSPIPIAPQEATQSDDNAENYCDYASEMLSLGEGLRLTHIALTDILNRLEV